MALEPLCDDVWSVASVVRLPGGVSFPVRMGVVRLPAGELLLYSPVALDDENAAALDRLGPVRHVIAPSLLHHRFAGSCLARYPEARLYGVPGLAAKRPDLPFAEELGDAPPAAFTGAIEQKVIDGAPALNEIALHHRPSGTLLVSDLVFNIRTPRGLGTKLLTRMFGTAGRLAQSRLWSFYARDRAAAAASADRVLSWRFDRLLPCHGDPVTSGAHAAVTGALARMRRRAA